jgi:prepilin-type N-terminal cleavage/methylation domain-containing protein
MSKKRKGFTIIEMLVVISIMGILISLIVSVGSYVQVRAQEDETSARLKVLSKAVLTYHRYHQEYPRYLKDVLTIPEIASLMQGTADNEGTIEDERFIDSFGNNFRYSKNNAPLIISYGADGQPSTEDDIRSDDRNMRSGR